MGEEKFWPVIQYALNEGIMGKRKMVHIDNYSALAIS